MNKIFEFVLVMIMGVGPVVMFVVLTESYGRYGLLSALIMCGIYLALVMAAILFRCFIRRCDPDPEADDLDLPPSYEDVTAKPPPYSFLFATAPAPNGDDWSSRHNYGGYVPVHAVTLTCPPVSGELHAAPPSYIEAVSGGGFSCGGAEAGISSCVTASQSASCSQSMNMNNTRPPSPTTTSSATTNTSHTAGGPSWSGNAFLATRVFIIPLHDPSSFPHSGTEASPLHGPSPSPHSSTEAIPFLPT